MGKFIKQTAMLAPIRISQQQKDWIDQRSRVTDLTISDIIRHGINLQMKQQKTGE